MTQSLYFQKPACKKLKLLYISIVKSIVTQTLVEDVILMSKTITYFLVSFLVYLEKERERETKVKGEKKKEMLEYMFTWEIFKNTIN